MKTKITLFLFLLSLVPIKVSAFEKHEPILIENVHATKEDPYIIEGYEISSDTANCIELKNSENIIIRNNYLHDCKWSKDDPLGKSEGFAAIISDSENITFENNKLEDNKQGLVILKSQNLDINNNDISKTILVNSLSLERCDGGKIWANKLTDNGTSDWFWAPGQRVVSIWLSRSSNFDIFGNTIVRSSSDGILVMGMLYGGSYTTKGRDWTGVSENIKIYGNTILDNMEIGIMTARADNVEIFNNVIRSGCFTPTGAIVLDFDVQNTEVYKNKILPCSTPSPVSIGMGKDNYIHDNEFYSVDEAFETIEFVNEPDEDEADRIKAGWSGIDYYPNQNNKKENNIRYLITGTLADEMKEKLALAEQEDTFSQKGWFSCEIREGEVDEECVKAEEAKGKQGVPREYMLYSSLMSDFDKFVEGKEDKLVEFKNTTCEKEDGMLEELVESWPVTVGVLVMIVFIGIVIYIIGFRSKREDNK